MLGLIYTLIVSTGALIYKINENKENKECKIKYKNPNGLTYTDVKGRSRFISNDELAIYTTDKNGDYILKDTNGNIYKNFSKEKREQILNENLKIAKENNETTYCIDDNCHSKDWIKKGRRFKDFNTEDVYIIRCINFKYYYMNISNGMIVRKTDWQIREDEKWGNDKFAPKDIDIEEFNKKQKLASTEHELFRERDYNYSCNIYK